MTKLDTVRSEPEDDESAPRPVSKAHSRISTPLRALASSKSVRISTTTEKQDRKQQIADKARKRGLLPSSSFRVSLSKSASTPALQSLPSSPTFAPVLKPGSLSPPPLDALSDAESVSSHSSASVSEDIDWTNQASPPAELQPTATQPAASPTIGLRKTTSSTRRSSRQSPTKALSRRKNHRTKRKSITIEGSIKAGTIGRALDLQDLPEDQMDEIAKAVLRV